MEWKLIRLTVAIHIPQTTQYLVISRCYFAQEMYEDLKRTCSAIVFLIKPFVLWRSRCRRRRSLNDNSSYRQFLDVSRVLIDTEILIDVMTNDSCVILNEILTFRF